MKYKKLTIVTLICVLGISIGALNVKAEDDASIKAGLKARVEAKFENNKNIRNVKAEIKDEVRDLRAVTTNNNNVGGFRASTTMMFKELKDSRKEIVKQMELRIFEIRKDALVKELTVALRNLANIKARIDERIVKAEGSGRDMTKAKAELVIAVDKMAKAKIAVDALASFTYSTSTVSVTASTTASTTVSNINIEKPRKIGDEAIKAVKEARNALKKVVVAITKDMGRGSANTTATTTATTTASTTTSI